MTDDRPGLPKENHRELSIKRHMIECRHFNGTMHDCCKAGVNYRALVGGPDLGWGLRLPCNPILFKHAPDVVRVDCDKRETRNREEAEALEDAHDAAMERFGRAHKAAKDDARAKGFKKNHGGVSELACPICGGVLHYSVSSYNGHMHGQCGTKGCVSWME